MQETAGCPMDKTEVWQRFQAKIASRQPIIGGFIKDPSGPDKAADVDLLALYHTAKFPQQGLIAGLLPLGNANQMVMELANALAAKPKTKPMFAGISAGDPFRLMQFFLEDIRRAGFAGIQNFPSVGIMDGPFRAHLESSASGYNKEIELIRQAHELGLMTAPLVFNPEEAVRMIEAGADLLVIHPPLRTCGFHGRRNARSQEDIVAHLTKTVGAARNLREDVIILYNNYFPDDPAMDTPLWQACSGLDGYWLA